MNAHPPRDQTELSGEPKYRWAGRFGSSLLRALGRTWEIDWSVPEAVAALDREQRPYLHAFWHEHLLALTYTHRDRGVVVLVSRSPDGEYISQILHRLGYGTVRGSSSRASLRALIEMARLGKSGHALAVTPDGPRGPRHVLQPGLLAIASRSGLPIVPLSVGARRARRLSSWDKFEVPVPFSRLRVFADAPLEVPSDMRPGELEQSIAPQVQAALERVETRAIRFANGDTDPLSESPRETRRVSSTGASGEEGP